MKTAEDSKIPQFESLEEERKYWEARGPLAEGHKGKITRPKAGQKRSSFLAVRLTGEELTRLRDIAEKQGMGPSTFARLVLTEALERKSELPESRTAHEVMAALQQILPQKTKEKMEAISTLFTGSESPILLRLNDKNEFDEFARLTVAVLLSLSNVQVVPPDSEERREVRRVAETRGYKAK